MGQIAPGQEQIASGEDAAIQSTVQSMRRLLDRMYPPGAPLMRRDAHAKHHGVVRAEFTVSPDVPAEARHGVFAEPRTYPAWIRFSNCDPRMRHDLAGDLRGMAIKLMGIPGDKLLDNDRSAETQDFLLGNYPVFFSSDVVQYARFSAAVARGNPFTYFFGGAPSKWHLREFRILMRSLGRIRNPLTTRYWSQTPYALGPHAVKVSAIPVGPPRRDRYRVARDFLRETMALHLRKDEAVFDFAVQFRTDPGRMPVEDPTVEWDERQSPFLKVATIRIPPQTFDSPRQMTFAENLSFTPWHALPEHRPLGGINRVRRAVYDASSAHRHERNGVPRREPGIDELP